MEVFGAAFSEVAWDALSSLDQGKQKEVLDLLFSSEYGANFNLCRIPIGANDFSLKWFSYDEVDGDFELTHFSIENDEKFMLPFIKAAQKIRSDLAFWASPWSPPTWMKINKHYAMSKNHPSRKSNGINADQLGFEGQDYFNLKPDYIRAYAKYFRRFVESYREHGIRISTVMPQNEFNSAQPLPSCCWTAQGLAQFIPSLGKALSDLGVEVLLGTLERGSIKQVDEVFKDRESSKVLKGIGVQWSGRRALPLIRHTYPNMRIWGTEQECGAGNNDWHYAKYAWGLIKTYLTQGASVYQHWNMILGEDAKSTWGWSQNSLITIDQESKSYRLNPEYYLMRHLSAYVKKGAKFISVSSWTGYENQIAFLNPDESIVIVLQNEMSERHIVRARIGSKKMILELPPDSFNTIVIPPGNIS
jgi:glucosylceramidase